MIQACLNGNRRPGVHPRLPVTPAQLADATLSSAAAGASMVHVHPRNERGLETLDPHQVVAAVGAIRERAPGIRVSVTTRDGIADTSHEKLALVQAWPGPELGGPDCASVNWHEDGAADLARTLVTKGITIEAGIWTPQAATRFVATHWPWRVERILVEALPGISRGSTGRWAVERILAALGMLPAQVLVHGEGPWTWPVLRWARAAGYATRIGLEDTLAMPSGHEAYDNAALVEAARQEVGGAATWPLRRPT
ncbi:MAG: 3-keto-5-aminohexanoate cleavage protein [Intrasporangium sp.]|uniref:3-keto-5-aminohexanoate cleavage protein n=1 Tax=Intrasporangium sp. TaxID=1925024 RepID=UPI002649486E|nr:3-keto-5-aminohexanoate cleavage protein [Intrasporangium sp.]MDN5798274.1 3-keto-5-aminohexanoate cleavage protein [Intrasporangium sp.]